MSEPTRLKAIAVGAFCATPIAALGIFAGSIIVGMSPEFFIDRPETSLDENTMRSIPTSYVVAGGSILMGALISLIFRSGRTYLITNTATMLLGLTAIAFFGGFQSFQFATELGKLSP